MMKLLYLPHEDKILPRTLTAISLSGREPWEATVDVTSINNTLTIWGGGVGAFIIIKSWWSRPLLGLWLLGAASPTHSGYLCPNFILLLWTWKGAYFLIACSYRLVFGWLLQSVLWRSSLAVLPVQTSQFPLSHRPLVHPSTLLSIPQSCFLPLLQTPFQFPGLCKHFLQHRSTHLKMRGWNPHRRENIRFALLTLGELS